MARWNNDDWDYLGEGNAHVVFQYKGNDPRLYGRVLRLTKQGSAPSVAFDLGFVEHVMRPLLGGAYIDAAEKVTLPGEFLHAIQQKSHAQRSANGKADARTVAPSASLMIDYTRIFTPNDTWTFEIKPKWGFLPSSPKIDVRHRALKQTMCRFCMHQRLRLGNVSPDAPATRYCPLNLFSGDKIRMETALASSLRAPHKYMHVFYNGKRVDCQKERIARCRQLLLPGTADTRDDGGQVTDTVAQLLAVILRQDPILARIKDLQQKLDALDIEGIYPLYEKQKARPLGDYNLDEWCQVVETFLARDHAANQDRDKNDAMDEDNENDERQRLHEYVLSMTLKDCSVMVCVTPVKDRRLPNGRVVDFLGSNFLFEIKVVDVGMKSSTKIPYWYDLDGKIVKHNLGCGTDWHCRGF
ncbi:inositol-pentakisphosphate 2-kinase [Gongronella butleri]|nr:inositol-pentakisphosphate 2-kinase [Gongronella butleri]